jgi:hypothetical protein
MRDPVALDRILQRPDHRLLPDELAEGLRSILAREHAVRLRRRGRLRRLAEVEEVGHQRPVVEVEVTHAT